MVVFDLVEGIEGSRIDFWIQSIQGHVKNPIFLVVGTHLDDKKCMFHFQVFLVFVISLSSRILGTKKLLEDTTIIMKQYEKRFPNLRFFTVSSQTGKGIDDLKKRLALIALHNIEACSFLNTGRCWLTRVLVDGAL